MKLATEPSGQLSKDRGISRMILLSAVLHVVVIGLLVVSGQLHTPLPPEPMSRSYEVSLVGPAGIGRARSSREKTAPTRSVEQKKTPIPEQDGQRAALLKPIDPIKPKPQEPQQKLVEKPVEQTKSKVPEPPKLVEPTKPQPPVSQPKPLEQAKSKVKEPSAEKPREVAKEREPEKPQSPPVAKEKEAPKPKPKPVVKEPEPPKVVAAAKPVEKKPPPATAKIEQKVPEPVRPKAEVQVSEKKQKAKVQDPKPAEPAKTQEKKPEAKKKDEPPKGKSTSSQSEKKEPAEPIKATTATKNTSPPKKENTKASDKKQTVATPAEAKKSASEDVDQDRRDEEAREKLIASAVERVRSREESASRERDITKAIERVRGEVGSQPSSGQERSAKLVSVPSMNIEKGKEYDLGSKAKIYGPEFISYTENIKQRVKDGWILVDRKPKLRAVVRFGVEADGGVRDVELVNPSGDRSFDQSALRAVRNAKLPPPPEAYREDFALQKVNITFGSEE